MTVLAIHDEPNYSTTPKMLRSLANRLQSRDGEKSWDSELCRAAAKEIELLTAMIVRDPVEIQIEEGDRANG